ncbi:hypothetical protein HZI73_02580 [Vallitalea pronyensis]|uniref:ABC transmembrane type-1 domain-containing protein n=1 Tax=Vallitalea pronyensis TaxID=1348613 RepID=A0A8J8MGM6_9FIRM|nr:hypothetical protein [Vallitalea pronyensis]QUI21234.1 hypothetical protein HZI73_02580 [Vallitalea pronyensis]
MLNDYQQTTKRKRNWGFCYAIAIPAILLLVFIKVVPFLKYSLLPFKEFNFMTPISDSPWVGLTYFKELFTSEHFSRMMRNTLGIKLGYILLCALISFILVLSIQHIRSKKVQDALAGLFLIPYFIPTIVLSYIMIQFFTSSLFDLSPLVQTQHYKPIVIMALVLKNCGIPVIITLGAIRAVTHPEHSIDRNTTIITAMKCIGAFSLIQVSALLMTDFELSFALLNPATYISGDTLNFFSFRKSLMELNISLGTAILHIQYIVQLVLSLLMYVLIKNFFKDVLFPNPQSTQEVEPSQDSSKGSFGSIVALLYVAFLLVMILYPLVIRPFMDSTSMDTNDVLSQWMPNYTIYLAITLVSVLLNAVLTTMLAYPLTVNYLPGRGLYKIFLLLILNINPISMGQYLYFKDLDMVNTYLPYIFTGLFSIMHIFVLKSIFNAKCQHLREEALSKGRSESYIFGKIYLPHIIKPLIGLSVLQFAMMWNSYTTSMIYINDPMKHSPAMLFKAFLNAGPNFNDPLIMRLGLILSLPPILLFIIFRRFMTSDVFVSQTRH